MDLCSIVGAKKATDLGRLFERKRFESREEAQGSQRGGAAESARELIESAIPAGLGRLLIHALAEGALSTYVQVLSKKVEKAGIGSSRAMGAGWN